MTQDADYKLIKEFLEGDETAFNKIVIKYRRKIYWHARRMLGNHLDADDVTQEVILAMYKKLNGFRFQSALSTWIYRITNTRSINQIRKNKLRRFISLDDSDVLNLSEKTDVAASFDDKEKLERLDIILKKLPVKQREVFLLKNFEQLTYEEISKITGRSVGGLKANYFHAIKKVTEMMK